MVSARLTSTGELQSVDGYMNIALEKTEEYVNGVKRRTYGDAFVRGNNGKHYPTNTFYTPRSPFTPSHVYLGRLVASHEPCVLRDHGRCNG